jgi:hypothetical protein
LIEKIYLTKQKLGINFAKTIQPLERTQTEREVLSQGVMGLEGGKGGIGVGGIGGGGGGGLMGSSFGVF